MSNVVEYSQEETLEIERHKYFLSEKAGHDVGWDHAARDWEDNFGGQFRSHAAHHAPIRGTGISMLFKRLFAK